MKSQIFTEGGGAGIGSYVIVLKNGNLVNASAEKIRWSYDSGENLFLSILDESTEEALLPLTGYVDNEGKLHLSGRDFDDNKTYEITVENEHQTVAFEEKEGVTIGDTTIPTSGGGGASFSILSQVTLEYNGVDDINTITFPENVIPLVYYIAGMDEAIYFDYSSRQLVNDMGVAGVIHGRTNPVTDGKISFYIEDVGEELHLDPTEDFVEFMLMDGEKGTLYAFNSYNFLHTKVKEPQLQEITFEEDSSFDALDISASHLAQLQQYKVGYLRIRDYEDQQEGESVWEGIFMPSVDGTYIGTESVNSSIQIMEFWIHNGVGETLGIGSHGESSWHYLFIFNPAA